MLKAIFYARFHPERGPDVLHQVPEGSIARATAWTANGNANTGTALSGSGIHHPSASTRLPQLSTSATLPTLSLVDFTSISAYVIPPHELSNRPLAICTEGCRVLGFPISIEGEGYKRNRFVCNVCFVVEEQEEDVEGWQGVVRKMAAFMRGLEVEGEGGVLRGEERVIDECVERGEGVDGIGRGEGEGLVVRWVLKEVFEQLNGFGECCVRVSSTQVLNLRLERRRKSETVMPKKIRAWDVPLIIRDLPDKTAWTWDLVLDQIHPHINGINPINRIARLADVDLKLVKRAIRELVSHNRALVLDIFHFQAIYAPTKTFTAFVNDPSSLDECRSYVAVEPKENFFAGILSKEVLETTPPTPTRETIINLYSVLKPGLTVADFALSHQETLANIDIRRLITYGTIKGFLKRMHRYALALDPPPPPPAPTANTKEVDLDLAWRKAALSSGWATPPAEGVGELQARLEGEEEERVRLGRFLDGRSCLDEVCLEFGVGEREVLERVRKWGAEVVGFCR